MVANMNDSEVEDARYNVTLSLSTLLIICSVGYYLHHRYKKRRLYELAEKIPGPTPLPIFGNMMDFIGGPHRVFETIYGRNKQYDNVVKLWAGPRLFVFLTNPIDIELILSSHVHIDKSPEYKYFRPWLGNGLLISSGEKWRLHRKLIAPTFHINILKSFIPLFNTNSRSVIRRLESLGNKEFDCHDYMSETTVEILLETAMGVNKQAQDSGYDYAMAVMKMCDILHARQTKVWLRPEIIFQNTVYGKAQKKLLAIIHGLTKKVLKIRKEEYEARENIDMSGIKSRRILTEDDFDEKNEEKKDVKYSYGQSSGLKDDLDINDQDIGEKKRLAFLDLLIENSQHGVVLSDEEIQNQVDTIMFEGHDTTAAASSFFLCMMAAHPEVQDKIMVELNQIFGDSDRPCTFKDTLEMKYLERCLMETLRLYPPVPIIARELREEIKLVSRDLTIPANCTVIIGTFKLHRRGDVFENPDTFNPDNFLPEKSASRHFYSFIPFSAGPRSCVGRKYAMLKLKVLLSTMLRYYRILPGIAEKDWLLQADIILKRTDGFNVKIEPRRPLPKEMH